MLATGAAAILQLNLGRAGGLLEAKKIAGMAEATTRRSRRTCTAGPSSAPPTSSSPTCSPNFLLLEGITAGAGSTPRSCEAAAPWEDGYVLPPTEPGLGVELDEEVAGRHPVQR